MRNTIVHRVATLVAATLIALVLAACGGGGGAHAAATPAGNVGPAGATIASADGNATLVIPPGALNSTISVTLTPATPADGYADDPQILAGTAYKLDAPETALSAPAAFSIALPASAAAAKADTHRGHALAIIPANQDNFVGCYLQVFDPLSQNPSNFSFIGGFGKGVNVPYQPGDLIVCAFANGDVNVDYGPNSTDVICPPGWGYRFQEYWDAPSYFRDTASGNVLEWPAGSGMGYITMCAPSPDPVVNVVSLLPAAKAILGAASAPVFIPTMGPQILALFMDSTPPSVQLSSTVLPAANGMVTLHLVATASDNVGVTKVQLFDESVVTANLAHSNIFVDLKSSVATFTAPPYVWDSAPMSPDQLYAAHHSYSATAFDAAGNMKTAALGFNALTPAITSFVATPATLPAGGGDVNLTWTTPPATAANFSDTLAIDHGIGNVTGSAGATAHITSTTTFTITGTNPTGTGSATVTVTAAPAPAPTITSFSATPTSLSAGGGNVTLAWTTSGASTLAIDHGVGTVTGDSGSVVANVTASTPFTLTATNAGGSVASTVTVIVAANSDRFVDVAAGSDSNDCSQPSPCKSIAKAMTGALSGSTVFLAPGLYAPATQGNGATVPDGVALKSSTAGAATLADGVTLTVAGSSAINGIVLDTSQLRLRCHHCERHDRHADAGLDRRVDQMPGRDQHRWQRERGDDTRRAGQRHVHRGVAQWLRRDRLGGGHGAADDPGRHHRRQRPRRPGVRWRLHRRGRQQHADAIGRDPSQSHRHRDRPVGNGQPHRQQQLSDRLGRSRRQLPDRQRNRHRRHRPRDRRSLADLERGRRGHLRAWRHHRVDHHRHAVDDHAHGQRHRRRDRHRLDSGGDDHRLELHQQRQRHQLGQPARHQLRHPRFHVHRQR